MIHLNSLRLAVAGAGAFGLCVALRAAQAGAIVDVFDPSPIASNASGVAAGMIAPLGEALFDQTEEGLWPWLRDARDLWPELEAKIPGLGVLRGEALFRFNDNAAFEAATHRLAQWGVGAVAAGPLSWRVKEDWRIDPPAVLATLLRGLLRAGGRLHPSPLEPGDLHGFDAVVLAGGFESRAFTDLAPELSVLQPVKGHILSFPGAHAPEAILRTPDVYLVAQTGRLLAGATMQPGRNDLEIEPMQVESLHRLTTDLRPDLRSSRFQSAAGVRAATPDGLPMVGPSSTEGLWLATGARRNGWLFAPLVAEILLSYLSGADAGRRGKTMDPARFL